MEPEKPPIKTRTAKERARIKQRKIVKRRSFWLILALISVLLDQISKWYVTEVFLRPYLTGIKGVPFTDWYTAPYPPLGGGGVQMTSFFNLVMAWNTGVSFSMFSGQGHYTWIALIVVALGITGVFIYWLWHADQHKHGICYALVIGGALGNVIDRVRFGAVIDFLDFHIYGYHWPAFNVADMSVVCGISLLIIISLFFDIKTKDRYRKRKKKQRAFKRDLMKRFGATHIITRKR